MTAVVCAAGAIGIAVWQRGVRSPTARAAGLAKVDREFDQVIDRLRSERGDARDPAADRGRTADRATNVESWRDYCASSPEALSARVSSDLPEYVCKVVLPAVMCIGKNSDFTSRTPVVGIGLMRSEDRRICVAEVNANGVTLWSSGVSTEVGAMVRQLHGLMLQTSERSGVVRRSDDDIERMLAFQDYLRSLPNDIGK